MSLSPTFMTVLPFDLVELIAKEIEDDPSIFNLRLVSKSVNSAVTPLALRVVVVRDSIESASAVSFLQDCDGSVTSHVREVIFRGYSPGNRPEEEPRDALRATFSRLNKFPNLHTLRLDFHVLWEESVRQQWTRLVPEKLSRFYHLQTAIFAGLAENPPRSLISLLLHNIYKEKNFHRVLEPVQNLEIRVLSEPDDEVWFEKRFLAVFWRQSVALMVRAATSLTSLTLRGDQPVGVNPPLSFQGATLPHLTSLVLHQFMLDPMLSVGSGVFAFILRHKATLTHLELHGCTIDGGEVPEFLGQWHTIFTRFEQELRFLRSFVFENRDGNPSQSLEFGYTRLVYEEYDYETWKEPIHSAGPSILGRFKLFA
ncbi:hypothetical protein B0H16DRAFT_1543660 [Mycena metata]|uniref:F-box domain-containing protein n=1 Tax=Mycena metata TaxID=1033252 RepID=A0AAD7NCL2_9AGAR|nr:hypothetical protein B0H16DRAFT_1543660 [Mycena metata]